MIYRLTYCNKDGVEARVDIQKGLATPVIEVEGTERPFILSYNNDKGNKSGMFLSSSADIEIYETTDFNIDNLKTSNETELSVTHYINNVVSWQGFIIPDFFSIEVRNNPVITMTASDRLGTLKNVTLSNLPSMISLRELAILCLNKTGLTLPLRTMADFNNGTGVNDFFNSKILTQRLSDTKGRSISCYDILSSILTASNSFLVQRSGGWHIINKIQHEAGSGKLYTGATSFINWSDVIFNFSDISVGGRRTIIPVASTVGVFHEFGGGRMHPENYDFSLDLTGWTPVGGFVATIDNRSVDTFTTGGSGGAIISPVYGDATEKKYLVNNNEYVRNVNPIYLESDPIPVFYKGPGAVNISLDINAVGPSASSAYIRAAIIATNGTNTKILDYSGNFIDYPDVNPPVFSTQFNDELAIAPTILKASSKGLAVSGKLEVEDDLSLYSLKIRLYGGGGGRYVLINSASVVVKSGANDNAKGIIYKVEREDNYTKAHDIDTSLFADYITTGLNGYFYDYSIDDTSSLYNSANELTSKWTAYNDPEQLPLLQHVTRQKSRLFSVAHDLLSAEIEASNFDPLAIFVACGIRHTVVSAQFDFFKSNLSVELEEVAFQSATVRDFIYSYFGDGESGIKSIGGISGGGGGGTGGGLTPEQLEILSFWKKDPDRENTIFTEMNAYSKLELSAYGVGDGGGGGGSDYERLDTWASYDSSKAGWVLSALLGNDLNTRVTNLENSAGGGSVTSVGISVPTGLSVSNSPITSSGVIAIGLQTGYSIPTTAKQGQWDTAYSNTHTHSNKAVLDGITSGLISNWNTAYTNSHTHSNKAQLDLITQSNIDVLAKLSIVNGNLQIDGNAYATGELSAYGAGTGGGGGGGIIETVYGYGNLGQTFNNATLTDTFNAYTINQINTRLVAVEAGSATTINTTGTGNAITSISKAGTVITANKGLTFSLSGHTHTISDITNLQTTLNSKLETSIFNTHNNDNVRHITGAERTKWDGVVTDFGNLEIGGRNLIPNSAMDSLVGWVSNGASVIEMSSGYIKNRMTGDVSTPGIRASDRISLKKGIYTLSVRINTDNLSTPTRLYLIGDGSFSVNIPKRTGWNTISVTFELENDRIDDYLYILTSSPMIDDYVLYDWVKLEKGNKPTDWSPAFEDQVSDWSTTDVNSFSFIKNKPTLLSQFTDNIGVATHIANTSNPHSVTKAQVGLGNVDNTSDLNKPISTAVQNALNLKLDKSVFDDLFEKVEVSTGVFAIKAKYDFYSVGEISAYGIGSGGSSGGGSYDRLDAWADYDSSKSGWVLSALLGNELNTRVGNLEGGSALTVNTTGTGNAITSLTKSGTVITATKGATFSLDNHLHTGVYEPAFSKNTAFNKNFGTTAGTVAEGNHTHPISSITDLQTALNGKASLRTRSYMSDSYRRFVIGVIRLDGGANAYSRAFGTITMGRVNGLYPNKRFDFSIQKKYNVEAFEGNVFRYNSFNTFRLCKFLYNGVLYGGFDIYVSNANITYIDFIGQSPDWVVVEYYNTQSNAVINSEIYNSLVEMDYEAGSFYANGDTIYTSGNLTSLSQLIDNIGVATHIANKANPHLVTTAQIGAVDLTTNQNIGGVKTFNDVLRVLNPSSSGISAKILCYPSSPYGLIFSTNSSGTQSIQSQRESSDSERFNIALNPNGGNVGIGTTNPQYKLDVSGTGRFTGNVTAPTFIGALSGNATTATTLATARTIWGQSFDGTGNITGALSGATTIAASISVTSPKVIFSAAGWSMEQVGSELQMKHNNVLKMRFTSTGSIVATEEITAFG